MCVRDSIVRGMHLVRLSSLKKTEGITSFVKNASFSRGWLHLLVQSFFAVITVASFILIVLMALPKLPEVQPIPGRESRCQLKNCLVYCEGVPYFGRYEEDIVYSVSQLPDICTGFVLVLHKPMFINNTLPTTWLPRLSMPLHELGIIGGNLMDFPPTAFLSQHAASIRRLVLYNIVIRTLTTDSLVGLSSLKQIYIKACPIVNIHANIFRSVHDTLQSLTIIQSERWDPANVTGTTNLVHLATVDFSNNDFHDILGSNSFTGLENCKTLYLNSCKISAIGVGAFDRLLRIEILFLNDNYLVTLPDGLFTNILSLTKPKPRINLQDNLWYCNCLATDLRLLVAQDMLLLDPICKSPEQYEGKTLIDFESNCSAQANHSTEIDSHDEGNSQQAKEYDDISGFVYVNNGCYNGTKNSTNSSLAMQSPVYGHPCLSEPIYKGDINRFLTQTVSDQIAAHNGWIKFTFFLKTGTYSMVQIGALEANNYGLLWYQSTCPNEVYCVNTVPTALRVYNIDTSAHYVFCPVQLTSGRIASEKCVFYNLATIDPSDLESKVHVLLFMSTGGICLVLGAICVYALVRKFPSLLKGSKRILFVKHKSVDALVLPPKVPIRNDLVNEDTPNLNEKKIFIVPSNSFGANKFNSTRSSKSNAPSYISALHPTEDELAEWRIRNLNNDLTSDLSTYSWLCSTDPFQYTEIVDNDKTYESLK
ncbi:uncharacterized protein LOC142987856 [Anticarsia gemmatalis]|uniref:uncharacterized protein LOC142987856 n=1 Tax=Anticarsia gemmatalis TaxID=129554 RepID=UPI003F76FDBD